MSGPAAAGGAGGPPLEKDLFGPPHVPAIDLCKESEPPVEFDLDYLSTLAHISTLEFFSTALGRFSIGTVKRPKPDLRDYHEYSVLVMTSPVTLWIKPEFSESVRNGLREVARKPLMPHENPGLLFKTDCQYMVMGLLKVLGKSGVSSVLIQSYG